MKAINIDWDIDYPEDLGNLPTEIEIPEDVDVYDEIDEYLSSVTGFCYRSYELVD